MRTILKAFLFTSLMAVAMPAFAQVHLSINFGPPPPRREVIVQSPYPGGVWIPGYYVYQSGARNYVWTPGRWQAPPAPQQRWVAPRYVRNGDHYDYYEGKWQEKGKHHDNGKHKGWDKQKGGEAHGDHGR